MKKRKKIFVKLIRNIETIKTVAIILLMVSCVYFGILIFQYHAIPSNRELSFFIWNNFEYMFEDSKDENLSTGEHEIMNAVASPIYVVADNISGRKIFYRNDEAYTEICKMIDNYIFAIYTGEYKATTEKLSSENDWIADLNSEFIYAKLPIDISAGLLTGTEYDVNVISKSIASYDEIIITKYSGGAEQENSTVIYLASSKGTEILRIILDKPASELMEVINSKQYGAEKDCIFAFELQNEEFSEYDITKKINQFKAEGKLYINPMLTIPFSTIDTQVISAEVPKGYSAGIYTAENSDVVDDILSAFEYDKSVARQYSDNDGNVVFVDGTKTLEFSKNAAISYTNSANGLDKKAQTVGISDLYKKMYRIFNSVYDNLSSSEESIVLTSVNSYIEETEKNVITELTFDYKIGGSTVKAESENTHFITAKLCNGILQSVNILLKDFSVSDEFSPNESAFTALERYIDSKSAQEGEIRICDMSLEYICNPSSINSHTKWVISTP